MLALVLAVTLAAEVPPEALHGDEPPPPPPAPEQKAGPSVALRVGLSSLAALGGVGLGLGVTALYSSARGASQGLDFTFSNAVLSGLLAPGLALVVHQILGGKGEIVFAALASLGAMAIAGLVANLIDPTVPNSMLLTSAIGAVPAVVASVLGLELSQGRVRAAPVPMPVRGGVGLAFAGQF